jgi:DNA-binding IscR family transcriptional regulator
MFTKQFEIAIEMLTFLDKEMPAKMETILKKLNESGHDYTAKYPQTVMRVLTKADLVRSVRGMNGGYLLPDHSITALDVLDATTEFRSGNSASTQDIFAAIRKRLSEIYLTKNAFLVSQGAILQENQEFS